MEDKYETGEWTPFSIPELEAEKNTTGDYMHVNYNCMCVCVNNPHRQVYTHVYIGFSVKCLKTIQTIQS